MKAADLCKELGIQPYVLKFWETEFPQLGKRLDEKRLYDAGALEIAREIHRLIDLERCSLVEARHALEGSHPSGEAPADDAESAGGASVHADLKRELGDLKRRIADLERENAGLRSRVAAPRAESVDPRVVAACLDEARGLAREADDLVRDLLEAAASDEEAAAGEISEGEDRSLFP